MGVILKIAGFELTDIEASDAPEVFARLTSKPSVMRYLPIKVHGTVEETEKLIAYYGELRAKGAMRIGVIRTSDTPWQTRIIGVMGFSATGHAIALALKIAPDRYAMGVGRILAPHVVHWLLAHDNCRRVWAYTDVDNHGVANLLRKMGALCEGTLRKYAIHPNISDEPRDCHIWSIIK